MLNRLTLSELTARLARRECSAREATQACLDQIQKVDGQIHAFISYNAEDALAVSEHGKVIFVDAVKTGVEPFSFRPLAPAATISFSTHAMPPEAVLALCRELYGKCPDTYLLAIRGHAWEPNAPMTREATANLAAALAFLKQQLPADFP